LEIESSRVYPSFGFPFAPTQQLINPSIAIFGGLYRFVKSGEGGVYTKRDREERTAI